MDGQFRRLFYIGALGIIAISFTFIGKNIFLGEQEKMKDAAFEKVGKMQAKVGKQREAVFEVGDEIYGKDDAEWNHARVVSEEVTTRDISLGEQGNLAEALASLKQSEAEWEADAALLGIELVERDPNTVYEVGDALFGEHDKEWQKAKEESREAAIQYYKADVEFEEAMAVLRGLED